MKKIIIIMLTILMVCTIFVACGNNDDQNDVGNDISSNVPTDNIKDNKKGYKEDKDLPGRIKINLTTAKYCIDAPETWSKMANTGDIVESDSYFVIYDQYVDISSDIAFDVDLSSIKTAKDVISGMSKQMAATALNGLIFADEYTVEVTKSEDVKVNSWDMCKTTGTIKLACEYPLAYESANFVAYSVIKDGYPVYFAVVENPEGEESIDLEKMADKIAKTFREYSED